jgi:hypothetical protein
MPTSFCTAAVPMSRDVPATGLPFPCFMGLSSTSSGPPQGRMKVARCVRALATAACLASWRATAAATACCVCSTLLGCFQIPEAALGAAAPPPPPEEEPLVGSRVSNWTSTCCSCLYWCVLAADAREFMLAGPLWLGEYLLHVLLGGGCTVPPAPAAAPADTETALLEAA